MLHALSKRTMREAIFLPFRQYSFTICSGIIAPFLASVDKGTHGFSRGKTAPGCVILVGGRQPTCLVCLASRRLSSVKNSEGLAGAAGALPARQRTQACWRKSRTITPQAAFQPRPQACVPLSTDAFIIAKTDKVCVKFLFLTGTLSLPCYDGSTKRKG